MLEPDVLCWNRVACVEHGVSNARTGRHVDEPGRFGLTWFQGGASGGDQNQGSRMQSLVLAPLPPGVRPGRSSLTWFTPGGAQRQNRGLRVQSLFLGRCSCSPPEPGRILHQVMSRGGGGPERTLPPSGAKGSGLARVCLPTFVRRCPPSRIRTS